MDKQPNPDRSYNSETTRIRFSKKRNRVELIVDPEWSSVLRPGMNDTIELGTSNRHPGALVVFVDSRWQGTYLWRHRGKRGALLIPFERKRVFDWCRNLLADRFEYVPSVIEPLNGYPGIRGITLDWPGWVQVVASNLSPEASEDLLSLQLASRRSLPELFSQKFIDGERVLV